MDLGDTIMAAGLVRAERNQANASIEYANKVIAHEAWRADENAKVVNQYRELLAETEANRKEFVAKVHSLRARNDAHEEVEASMSEVIARYEPDNPLTSPEHVEALVEELQATKYIDNPATIKRTFPSGVVPDEYSRHYAEFVEKTKNKVSNKAP